MSEIQLFNNGEFELRFTAAGDSYTVDAPGLARALGFRDAYRLVESLPDAEKGYTTACTPGGKQRVWHVTEAGFYRALGQRQVARIRDIAVRQMVERFQNWVYREVLPSIRRTGGYVIERRTPQLGVDLAPPDVYSYVEVCALLRQHFGVDLSVNELTRKLRAAGVLRQDGQGPTAKYKPYFHFSGSAWYVTRAAVPQIAYKTYEISRELQDFRFLQMRLELDGVGFASIQS